MGRYNRGDDMYVLCPYFKWRNGHTIACEGFFEGQTIKMEDTMADIVKVEHKQWCKKDYKDCPIYQMITREVMRNYD